MRGNDSLVVLIVDDEEIVRHTLKSFFTFLDHEVEEAEDGVSALRMLESKHFDGVVADIRMPMLSGIGFLRKALKTRPKTPVVLITGHGDEETRKEAMMSGAMGLITKPFDFKDVLWMISTFKKCLGR